MDKIDASLSFMLLLLPKKSDGMNCEQVLAMICSEMIMKISLWQTERLQTHTPQVCHISGVY